MTFGSTPFFSVCNAQWERSARRAQAVANQSRELEAKEAQTARYLVEHELPETSGRPTCCQPAFNGLSEILVPALVVTAGFEYAPHPDRPQ